MIYQLWELLDHVSNFGKPPEERIVYIWAFENSPRIDKPYVTINWTNVEVPNFDWTEPYLTDVAAVLHMASWRAASVELQFFYGDRSYSVASELSMRLSGDSSLTKQYELDCAIGNRLFFGRIPELLNTSQFEDRHIFQFVFLWTERIDDYVGEIETVELQGTVSGGLTPGQVCNEIVYKYPNDSYWDNNGSVWDWSPASFSRWDRE